MHALLLRKLLVYAMCSAAVTALPVMATSSSSARAIQSECLCQPECECSLPLNTMEEPPSEDCVIASRADGRWWCRGPLRRGVRAVALAISRPWRN